MKLFRDFYQANKLQIGMVFRSSGSQMSFQVEAGWLLYEGGYSSIWEEGDWEAKLVDRHLWSEKPQAQAQTKEETKQMKTISSSIAMLPGLNIDAAKEAAKLRAAHEGLILIRGAIEMAPIPEGLKSMAQTPIGMLSVLQAIIIAADASNRPVAKEAAERLLVKQYEEMLAAFLPSFGSIFNILEGK